MVFSSIIFILLFLPLTFALYFLPFGSGRFGASDRWKNSVLLISSLIFYSWGEGIYVAVMLFSVLLNWGAALLLDRFPAHRRLIVTAGVFSNLSLLGYYKYAGFLFENVSPLLPQLSEGLRSYLVDVHLPIGVSFFTFQAMSYLIDVSRGEVAVQRNPLKLALYVTFFPQLIAGPIVRYKDVAEAIEHRRHSLSEMCYGAQRFIMGLAQKVLFANTLGEVADTLYSLPLSELSTLLAWTAAIAYTFQIYYDFCGYSNMAIGIARMFGFRFLENFNFPYVSCSITEFWRRWHISLSTWFRDYLYIPLGGNRAGALKTYRNLFLVFALCGLWHGASWNFILWGLFHGMLLITERAFLLRALERVPRILARCYTLGAVIVGWVLFRVEELDAAWVILQRMFGLYLIESPHLFRQFVTPEAALCAVAAALCAVPWGRAASPSPAREGQGDGEDIDRRYRSSAFALSAQLALLVLVLSYLAAGQFNPFIYFRF